MPIAARLLHAADIAVLADAADGAFDNAIMKTPFAEARAFYKAIGAKPPERQPHIDCEPETAET